MHILEELDPLFEKGFLSFLTVTIVTVVGCQLLSLACDKELKHYYERHKGRLVPNDLLSKTLKFLIWAFGVMAIGRQITAIRDLNSMVVGASGIAATICGIAARVTFSNYISGFFLNIHQPFRVGGKRNCRKSKGHYIPSYDPGDQSRNDCYDSKQRHGRCRN